MNAQIQIFGQAKSSESRKARRFFAERGIAFHDVDVKKKPPSPGELRKWVARFGVDGVLDADSKVVKDRGLRYLGGSHDDWIARMVDEPAMIRLPLVRCGKDLSVGEDPASWQRFADAVKA
jgi:arsenate reductase-like glutaredoxin family protein